MSQQPLREFFSTGALLELAAFPEPCWTRSNGAASCCAEGTAMNLKLLERFLLHVLVEQGVQGMNSN